MNRSIGHPIGFRLLFAVTVSLCLATAAAAQQARVQRQRPPHYVGESILIRITAEQFDGDSKPTCTPGPVPDGILLNFVTDRHSVNKYSQWDLSGRRKSVSVVVYSFDFRIVSTRSGTFRIPSFTVKQGGKTAGTEPFNLKVTAVAIDENMRITLNLPSGPVYVGQRVPVSIEWSYVGDLNDILANRLYIRSPLFDEFSFDDEPPRQGDNRLPILTEQGIINLKASLAERTLDGHTFIVVTATRTMKLEKPGVHDLPAITAHVEKVTSWGRTLFDDRSP